MWMLFILPDGIVTAAHCVKPSLDAYRLAAMAFDEKPKMAKDRFGIENAPTMSARTLDAHIKKWLK